MLRVLGSNRKLCHGVSRRDLLRVGGLGMAGLSLSQIAQLQDVSAAQGVARPKSFGRAKSLILLHLYGSPSQLEWADMKPHAPAEVKGELGGIASTLPGCDVCELLPEMAKVMDRTTVLRSLTHPYPIHGVAFALTGIPAIDVAMELSPDDARHQPFIGSVIEYMDRQANGAREFPVPRNIGLPFPFSSRRVGEVARAGPYAMYLGKQYNPVWTDFIGTATGQIDKTLGAQKFSGPEPYLGVKNDAHFVVPSATQLPDEITIDRLDRRRSLLEQFDAARKMADQSAAGKQWNRYQEMAFSLANSATLRESLDIRRESEPLRESYGYTLFGQACLAARRLVEAGTKVVTVVWDEFGLAGDAWDTHYNHYTRMRKALCPGLDRAWYGLISDLDQRGLLDETLVVCTSEHGRTPRLNGVASRDHWSQVYTSMIAGGGVKRGCVVGASDKHGAEVADRPISPKDLLATIYHLLGIDHHTMITDRQNRPIPLVTGDVITEALM